MTNLTYSQRVERLQTMIEEGRLIRNAWTAGQERACLLAALSPEVGEDESASACPASVMPQWLAFLTPDMDDRGSVDAWPSMIRRYAAVAARWHILDAAAWERARIRSLHAIVSEACRHCSANEVCALAAIDGVLAWFDAGAPEHDRERVLQVAEAAWRAAQSATAAAATAASTAAATAASTAAAAAWRAASWAAAAAAAASWAAAAAEAAEAKEEAWDRMTDGILAAIEAECDASETNHD